MAKKKEKTKLLSLSKVVDKDELDSVKASLNRYDQPYERAYAVLFEAQRYYNNMDNFRKRRLRNKRYNYGDQWGDPITLPTCGGLGKRTVREEDYIREQGSEPLKNNLIRRLVKNVLGVYRSQSKEPTCNARDKDEQKYSETMSIVLQCNRQLNRENEIDTRTMEEFMISGAAIHKKKYGWRRNRLDCWTDYVNPNNFFIDNNMRDFRGWDVSCLGEVHDVSLGEVLREFAKTPAEVRRLKDIYHHARDKQFIADSFQQFGEFDPRNIDFISPSNPTLCRVIEVWRKESKPRYRCHDYNNGDDYKIDVEDYHDIVELENQDRLQRGLAAGMVQEEIPMIKAEWFMDDYWYFYYLSPFGDILREGETPYAHGEHPYVFKFYPYIDGEIHSFVEDVIDQQRYVNRLITMYDFIMRASAKGVLLCPEDCLPDDMSWDDFCDEWSRFNGVVRYKPNNQGLVPQQVATNSVNIGIGDLLNYQLKFFEDISGVNGALQGKPGNSGTSGSLYAQQTQNATMSLLDILETFSQFIVDGAYKDVKNMQQYYDTRRTFNIVGRAGQIVEYDPKKIRDVEFDINITESTATPVYRQMANDFLMQLWQAQAISLEQLLQVGDFPFGDELMQSLASQQQDIKQGNVPQGFSPQLQQQVADASQTNPKAQAMLQQMMSGQGVEPSEQQAPLAEE
jgi:hypothetical protein